MKVNIEIPTLEEVQAILNKENGKLEFREMLQTLSRIELLAFEDAYESEEIGFVWNIFYEEMYRHEWPLKTDRVNEAINEAINDDINNVRKYTKQVQAIQKKLDRITKLLENAEFTISGKEAMEL